MKPIQQKLRQRPGGRHVGRPPAQGAAVALLARIALSPELENLLTLQGYRYLPKQRIKPRKTAPAAVLFFLPLPVYNV